MLKLSIKGFTVHMNYLHKAKNRQTYNYRRIVPADLKQHYSAREIIKSLKTWDETIALRKCAQVNRQVEAEFERLRSGLPKDQASSLQLAQHQNLKHKTQALGLKGHSIVVS